MAASTTDVEVSLGRSLTDTEAQQITQWIDDAGLQIKARLGDLDALDQDVLAYVQREAALMRFYNPDPSVQRLGIDDFTVGRYEDSRRVTILDEWWNLLSPATGTGIYSVRPYFEPDDFSNDFLDSWT